MSTVSEIETAIRERPAAADFRKLADWFNAAKDEAWPNRCRRMLERAGWIFCLMCRQHSGRRRNQELAGSGMNSTATPRFWQRLHELPEEVQALAA